jgi:hypothetical protein
MLNTFLLSSTETNESNKEEVMKKEIEAILIRKQN